MDPIFAACLWWPFSFFLRRYDSVSGMSISAQEATRLTYRNECWRATATGILETASSTFLLLIAVRHFQAGATIKGLIATGGAAGLLLSPVTVNVVTHFRWRASRAAAWFDVVGGFGMLLAALVPALPVFTVGAVLGMICSASAIPLLTQMYQDNYPERERGRRFSRTVMIRILATATFSEVAGQFLTGHLARFQWLLLVFAGALFCSSYCLFRCPSRPLVKDDSTHWLRAMRSVKQDRVFRLTLISWMLMGFGNLIMLPLRVEYLANPRYGMALSAGSIALFTGVVPNLARLVMSPIWGKLFDQVNFFLLRIILNLGFAVGIAAFFTGNSRLGLFTGAIVLGISLAGGDVAWSLWVTKLAPPDRVAEYMSVHTFFTGVRGVVAPLVAFQLAKGHSIAVMGLVCAGLIVGASLLLLPETRLGRRRRPAMPLLEEISE